MEALLDAHDSIATEVDRMPAKDSTVFAPNDTFELMIHQNIANDNIFNVNILLFSTLTHIANSLWENIFIFDTFIPNSNKLKSISRP